MPWEPLGRGSFKMCKSNFTILQKDGKVIFTPSFLYLRIISRSFMFRKIASVQAGFYFGEPACLSVHLPCCFLSAATATLPEIRLADE